MLQTAGIWWLSKHWNNADDTRVQKKITRKKKGRTNPNKVQQYKKQKEGTYLSIKLSFCRVVSSLSCLNELLFGTKMCLFRCLLSNNSLSFRKPELLKLLFLFLQHTSCSQCEERGKHFVNFTILWITAKVIITQLKNIWSGNKYMKRFKSNFRCFQNQLSINCGSQFLRLKKFLQN